MHGAIMRTSLSASRVWTLENFTIDMLSPTIAPPKAAGPFPVLAFTTVDQHCS